MPSLNLKKKYKNKVIKIINFVEICDFNDIDGCLNSVILNRIRIFFLIFNWLLSLYYCFFLYIYYSVAKKEDVQIEKKN
jgi:hypothetical protein